MYNSSIGEMAKYQLPGKNRLIEGIKVLSKLKKQDRRSIANQNLILYIFALCLICSANICYASTKKLCTDQRQDSTLIIILDEIKLLNEEDSLSSKHREDIWIDLQIVKELLDEIEKLILFRINMIDWWVAIMTILFMVLGIITPLILVMWQNRGFKAHQKELQAKLTKVTDQSKEYLKKIKIIEDEINRGRIGITDPKLGKFNPLQDHMATKVLNTLWTKQVNKFPKLDVFFTFRIGSKDPKFKDFLRACSLLLAWGYIQINDDGQYYISIFGFDFCKSKHSELRLKDQWWPDETINEDNLRNLPDIEYVEPTGEDVDQE